MVSKSKSFVLYKDFEPTLRQLSEKEAGILFFMIYSYVNRGEIDSDLKRTSKVDLVFLMIRSQLDRDAEKYNEICERNAANGRLGGRPKTNSKTQNNRSVFSKSHNDNENKNKNNNKNKSDSVTDNDNELPPLRSFDPDDFFDAAVKRSYEG